MKRIFKNILAIPFLAIGVVFGSIAFVCAFLAAWFTEIVIDITEDRI